MTTKLIIIAGFLVAFAAGLVSGLQSHQAAATRAVAVVSPTTGPATRPMVRRGGPGGPIRELNLTAEQQEQLNQIWTALAQRESREQEERRQARTDRDNNLMALIPIDSRAKYDEIKKSFDTQMASRDQEWRSAYDLAVERTKKILNADQRARYEQILSRNQSGRGRGPGPGFGGLRGRVSGRGDFPHDSRPEDSYRAPKSATQPVSVQ